MRDKKNAEKPNFEISAVPLLKDPRITRKINNTP